MTERLHPSPWDTSVFGLPCYEISEYSEMALAEACATPGHHSIKVDPLADKGLLHHYGFYYTDTLLTPRCTPGQLHAFDHPAVALDAKVGLEDVSRICATAFAHGRFHRDFNLPHDAADRRYVQWLEELHGKGAVIGLLFEDQLVGFIAHQGGALLLHAMAEQFRGRGLAKYLWTAACLRLFDQGEVELTSSVSAANLAVVNLYASLGFRFAGTRDTYHRMVESA